MPEVFDEGGAYQFWLEGEGGDSTPLDPEWKDVGHLDEEASAAAYKTDDEVSVWQQPGNLLKPQDAINTLTARTLGNAGGDVEIKWAEGVDLPTAAAKIDELEALRTTFTFELEELPLPTLRLFGLDDRPSTWVNDYDFVHYRSRWVYGNTMPQMHSVSWTWYELAPPPRKQKGLTGKAYRIARRRYRRKLRNGVWPLVERHGFVPAAVVKVES